MSKTALIIEDSTYMRARIGAVLEEMDIEIVGSESSGEIGLDLALTLKPDLVTLDNMLPDMTGMDVLEVFSEHALPSKVIMISSLGQQSMIQKGMDLGVASYILKPFETEQLKAAVSQALGR
ncbi:MAG: response regulator [Cyclobacteriaceae bacterium]|nr:response regulator [Cyclobacteriaceae bacterium HetDA_MAG_MS6]